jgi:HEAT repeat protein
LDDDDVRIVGAEYFGPDGVDAVDDPESERSEPGTGALDAFAAGQVRPAEVARLSDLGREAGGRFAREWPTLPEEIRAAIVRQMDELAEDRVELQFGRVLRTALTDPSPLVRQLAVAALWEDVQGDLPDRLRSLLDGDPSSDVRAEAARGLRRFAVAAAAGELDGETADALRDLLVRVAGDSAEEPHVRRHALEAAGAFGQDPVVRALVLDAYESDDPADRASALFAMGQSFDRSWLPTLLDELANDDAAMRFEAARACGSIGSDAAVPELLAMMDGEEDVEVRHAAISALGQIGGRSAVRALRTLAEHAEEADEVLIEAALEEASAVEDGDDRR